MSDPDFDNDPDFDDIDDCDIGVIFDDNEPYEGSRDDERFNAWDGDDDWAEEWEFNE